MDLQSGRKLRTSPLYTRQESDSAVFGQALGWERPTYFEHVPGDLSGMLSAIPEKKTVENFSEK